MNGNRKTQGSLMYLPMVAICFLAVGREAKADFTFGEPVNLKSIIPVLDAKYHQIDCFSSDGLEMYITWYNQPGGFGDWDLCVLRRASKDDDWGLIENLGPAVNSPKEDSCSSISADGLSLFFNSERPGGYGSFDIYVTTRATKNDPWGKAVILPPEVNRTGSNASDTTPWISPDGLELYFTSFSAEGYGSADIYVARRSTSNDPWGVPVNLGPGVNSGMIDYFPSLSPDGLVLFFSGHFNVQPPRPGGFGRADIWMTRRVTLSGAWESAVNLGPKINGLADDIVPRVSPDGSTLYFATKSQASAWDYWQVTITPVCDFNSDETVDLDDLILLINDWGTNETLCDIGPMPWGDGVVDIEDLKVFIKYWEQENLTDSQEDQ